MNVERRYDLLFTLLLTLLLTLAAPSVSAGDSGRPARLAVEPNAILRLDEPLVIEVEGVPPGDRVDLEVFGDCLEEPTCGRLYGRRSNAANGQGVVNDTLLYQQLVDAEVDTPQGRRLWLRVSFAGSERYRQAMFGYLVDSCTLFDTVIAAFSLGACDPGLAQVLRHHRQPSNLEDTLFEVRRILVDDPEAQAMSVPGTVGGNGIAWIDGKTLLVTATGSEDGAGLAAGLYRVTLGPKAKPPRLLWSPQGDDPPPAAPWALADGRIAFVLQATGPQRAAGVTAPAQLMLWQETRGNRKGGEVARIALPYKAHQILAHDRSGRQLLMLSLGVGDNRPMFLTADLETAEVTEVGFSNALYETAMRSPRRKHSVIALENHFAGRGWEMVLTQGGTLLRPLVKRDGFDDLAPAWRPDGDEVAYLAEVEVAP